MPTPPPEKNLAPLALINFLPPRYTSGDRVVLVQLLWLGRGIAEWHPHGKEVWEQGAILEPPLNPCPGLMLHASHPSSGSGLESNTRDNEWIQVNSWKTTRKQ